MAKTERPTPIQLQIQNHWSRQLLLFFALEKQSENNIESLLQTENQLAATGKKENILNGVVLANLKFLELAHEI